VCVRDYIFLFKTTAKTHFIMVTSGYVLHVLMTKLIYLIIRLE